MKLPTLFTLNKKLDEKLEQMLQRIKKPKVQEPVVLNPEGKREIIVTSSLPGVKLDNKIYVAFVPQKANEHYFLDISSNEPFYFPVSDNPIDWGDRRRHSGVAALKDEDRILNYLKLMEEDNDAVLLWEKDKRSISRLKERFNEKYVSVED